MHGFFELPGKLTIISSGHLSMEMPPESLWEHVSVALPSVCPTWEIMQTVKTWFWRDDEVVIQFHPSRGDYVNAHPFCLHLWKPPYKLELPPKGTLA